MRGGLTIILLVIVAVYSFGQNIVDAEYFVDTDLGIGSNTPLSVSTPDSEVTLDFTLPISSYREGLHTLYIRVKDSNGKWSIANSSLFLKLPDVLLPTVETAEYYIGNDPGFGNGNEIPVSGGSIEETMLIQADLSGLVSGLHQLNVRIKDSYGRWSILSNRLIQVIKDISNDEIVELEYYFTGSGDFISSTYKETVTPSSGIIDYSFLSDVSELTIGETYTLHLRPRGSQSGLGEEVLNQFTFESEIIWTGGVSQSWEIGANWKGGVTPSSVDNVRVPDVTNAPRITQNHEVKNVQIEEGAQITMTNDANLAVYGYPSGEGTFISQTNVAGSFAYSVTGSTVGEQLVADSSPTPHIIYGYNNGNFIVPSSMELGAGYFLAFNQSNPVLSLTGLPNSGNINRSISYTDNGIDDDYELLSNPFNASILHSEIVEVNGMEGSGAIDGVIYLWQDGGNNLPNGTRNGFYEVVNAEGVSTGSFDGILRRGQGFFVRAIDETVTEVSFLSTMQDINPSPSSPPGSRLSERSNVKIKLSNESSEDALVVCFSEDASIEIEQGYDALKLMNPSVSFYSKADIEKLAIQTLPIENGLSIPLGYSVNETGIYQMTITGIKPSIYIKLIDLEKEVEYDVFNGQVISFELSEMQNDDRFILLLNNSPLSLSMENIQIGKLGNLVKIFNPGASGFIPVSIYDINGKEIYNQEELEFKDGIALISANLKDNIPYLLSINKHQLKFMLD